jgi:hypothetical protein
MKDHEVIFEWESPEYESSEKSNDWFWGIGIGSACVIITTIIWKNYLFGIFIFISAIVVFIMNTKKPRIILKKITDQGIILDNMFFSWKTITRFCLTNEKHPRIILETNGFMHPHVYINLHQDGLDPEEIREYLARYIREEDIELSFFKLLAEKI